MTFLKNTSTNKGAGAARNIGLQHAKGKWILFADADDYFMPKAFQELEQYYSNKEDVIFFQTTSVYLNTNTPTNRHIHTQNIVQNHTNSSSLKTELALRYKYYSPCSKLIQKTIIDTYEIRFQEIPASNDVLFSTKVGHAMNSYIISDVVLYCITEREGSLTTTISKENFDSRLYAHICFFNYLKENLDKKKLTMLNISLIAFLYSAIRYKLGFKRIISVFKTALETKIPLFPRDILNPRRIKLLFQKSLKKTQ